MSIWLMEVQGKADWCKSREKLTDISQEKRRNTRDRAQAPWSSVSVCGSVCVYFTPQSWRPWRHRTRCPTLLSLRPRGRRPVSLWWWSGARVCTLPPSSPTSTATTIRTRPVRKWRTFLEFLPSRRTPSWRFSVRCTYRPALPMSRGVGQGRYRLYRAEPCVRRPRRMDEIYWLTPSLPGQSRVRPYPQSIATFFMVSNYILFSTTFCSPLHFDHNYIYFLITFCS